MGIEGIWYNELGSRMELTVENATITGVYVSAVGAAESEYELVGRIDTAPSSGGQAVGWTVVWTNAAHGSSHSATSWSGQYQESDGQEEIYSFWLLVTEEQPQNDWAATRVGQDTFRRVKPTEAEIARARRRRGLSRPRPAP
jgi:hypothetical protein